MYRCPLLPQEKIGMGPLSRFFPEGGGDVCTQASPRAYIFQRPFLRGLFLEGPIFGGAYVRREICVSKSIGLACSGKEIYHFCFVLLCIYSRANSKYKPPRGLIF